MAMQHGSERYTKFTLVGKGDGVTRRVHELTVQLSDGALHTLKGKYLPDEIVLYTGHGRKREHLAELLLGNGQHPSFVKRMKHGSKCYTKFTLDEKGGGLTRWVHHLDIQTSRGTLHFLDGKYLPHEIVLYTGDGRKGEHRADILLGSGRRPRLVKQPSGQRLRKTWPTRRDAIHVIAGFVGLFLLRFILSLLAAAC